MTFPDHWADGTEHHAHRYDERTVIIRQPLSTNFEAPFLYLLLGDSRALLLDTGTGDIPLRPLVEELAGGRELVVAHTHAHGDHVGGDGEFASVVGHSPAEVAAYFGIDWPHGSATIDLGERIVDVLPIPGHQGADIAFYDRANRLLFTGDSLYPGRLYVKDWAAYRASIRRLAGFVAGGNPVDWVLGAHIEMTNEPGRDYEMGADRHPDEHELQLRPEALTELAQVLDAAGDVPARIVRDDFVVYPV
jgi:glyoxylase-like metal-dependent hydrolase (beta-lactamase superfamily II)